MRNYCKSSFEDLPQWSVDMKYIFENVDEGETMKKDAWMMCVLCPILPSSHIYTSSETAVVLMITVFVLHYFRSTLQHWIHFSCSTEINPIHISQFFISQFRFFFSSIMYFLPNI